MVTLAPLSLAIIRTNKSKSMRPTGNSMAVTSKGRAHSTHYNDES